MMKRISTSLILAGALLAASAAHAQQEGSNSFLSALAGPGEKVIITTDRFPDGTGGLATTRQDPDGNFFYESKGPTTIESPKLNLRADYLRYDGKTGLLEAEGSVDVKQPGVRARSGRMVYNPASGEITLTGKPLVEQENEKNRGVFQGMERFVIIPGEEGAMEIRMEGGEEIRCEMTELGSKEDGPDAGGDVQDKPSTATGASGPGGEGFGGMGKNVKIATRPRGEIRPTVQVNTKDGAFSRFQANGSVLLESENMNLRSDTLDYDGVAQLVTAQGNVFIKQNEIDADCGRMVYDVAKRRIELTVNPEIRKREATQIVKQYRMAAFILIRNEDGSVSTQHQPGPEGPAITEVIYLDKPVAATTAKQVSAPKEIDLNNPDDLKRIK